MVKTVVTQSICSVTEPLSFLSLAYNAANILLARLRFCDLMRLRKTCNGADGAWSGMLFLVGIVKSASAVKVQGQGFDIDA
jgi:hypothetical protein